MCFLGPILFISFHPDKNESEKKRITIEAHPHLQDIEYFWKNLGITVHDTNQYTNLAIE